MPTAPEAMRNRDSDYPYRHDSYFYYLTGFTEPEAVLAIVVPGGSAAESQTRSVLFCRPKHEEREIWDGYRYGPERFNMLFRSEFNKKKASSWWGKPVSADRFDW